MHTNFLKILCGGVDLILWSPDDLGKVYVGVLPKISGPGMDFDGSWVPAWDPESVKNGPRWGHVGILDISLK